MSAIIGYKANDKVYMATDTHLSLGNYAFSDTTETAQNVFSLPHGVLCGAYNYRAKQIIQTQTAWFDGLANEPLTKRYLVQTVVPALYDALDKAALISEEARKEGRPRFDGAVLLAQKDALFCIDRDFAVLTIPKFCIIGSAYAFAYPRVAAYKGEMPLEDMLYAALSDARKWSRKVLEPYYLYSTDASEKKVLGGNR